MTANEEIRDSIIRHAVFLHKFGNGLADKVIALLNSADEEISAKIAAGMSTELGEKRLRALLDEVRGLTDGVYGKAFDLLQSELTGQAEVSAEFVASELSAALSYTPSLPSPRKLAVIATTSPIDGHLLKSWTDTMSANRSGRVERELRLGMIQGETIDQIVRRVRGSKANGYKDGVLEISRRSARSMVLTANATVAATARDQTYQANKRVIKAVQLVATLDTRTSPICQSRDGNVYPIDTDYPKPPFHIACRTIAIPVTKTAKEMGLKTKDVSPLKRASMDGQVPASTTYGEWLAKQPVARQDAILGKARADLFRSGKLPFKEMYRQDGSYKSVAELRQALDLPARQEPAPKPPKAATAPAGDFSPRNAALTGETLKVVPRSKAVKELSAQMKVNAEDPRHFARPEYRNTKVTDFGRAALGSKFTDESASAIAAVAKECDAITDRFGLPSIRAYKTLNRKGAGACMGDAVMSVNPDHFNRMTATIKISGDKLDAEIANLGAKKLKQEDGLNNLRAAITDLDHRRDAALRAANKADPASAKKALDEYDDLLKQRQAIYRDWETARREYVNDTNRYRELEKAQKAAKPSTWKAGDDKKDRPFIAGAYFADPIDKVRQTLYHETAHTVHQLYKKTAPRTRGQLFSLEQDIHDLYNRKVKEAGWKDRQPSTYATTEPVEWWAESFSLYMLGRKDMIDDDLVKLIEKVLNETRK